MSMQGMHKALIRVRLDSALLNRGLTLSIAGLRLIGLDSGTESREGHAVHNDPTRSNPSKDILLSNANLGESKSEFILGELRMRGSSTEMNQHKNFARL